MKDNQKLFAGVDVGSLTAEAVILREDGAVAAAEIIRVRPRAVQSAREVFDRALEKTGLPEDGVSFCVATGYGRDSISFARKNLSEISCHGRGAHYLDPKIRTVIDVGGQDCKLIRVDIDGHLEDFAMNDKCAAGTGRFLEMMARTMNLEIGELGRLSLKSRRPLTLSSQCTIFSEIEVLQLLYAKKKRRDIAAGVHAALVRRIKTLTAKVGLTPSVCMTGGVSKNQGMVSMLERELGVSFRTLPMDPQLVGALGAALFARDAYSARTGRPS